MIETVKNPAWYDDLKASYHADRRALAKRTGYSVNTLKKWFTGQGRWRVPSSVEYVLSRGLEVDKSKKTLKAKVNRWRRTRKPAFKREVQKVIENERPEQIPDDCDTIYELLQDPKCNLRFSSDDEQMLIDYIVTGGIPEEYTHIVGCNGQWHLIVCGS